MQAPRHWLCQEPHLNLACWEAGIYTNSYDASLNVKNGFPVFSTVIEANYIEKRENQFAAYKLTDEDKEEMHRLARDPRIGRHLPVSY